MERCRKFGSSVVVCFTLTLAVPAQAAWTLSNIGQGSFGLTSIADGTSNTILLGESSRADLCFDGANLPGGIADGTSNTILFGESAGLRVTPGSILERAPVQQIADGTSNTILSGEIGSSFCLGDTVVGDVFIPDIADGTSNTIIFEQGTNLDVCFRNVQVGILDGTSNTLLFGEAATACYLAVRPADGLVASIGLPASLALLLPGLAIIGAVRRRGAGA